MLVGVAVGSLLTGLAIPLASDDDERQPVAASGPGVTLGPGSPLDPGPVAGADGSDDRAPSAGGRGGGSGAVTGGPGSPSGPAAGSPTGTAGPGNEPGSPGGPGPAGTARTATDQGVTADAIKLGFALLDIGSVGQFGVGVPGVEPAQQRRAAEAYIADINARGGINGRTVQGVYATFDVVNTADHATACRKLVQDQGAFAVIAAGGYEPPGSLCVTQQFGRPLISSSNTNPDELYADAGGLLTTIFPRGGRMVSNVAAEMARAGLAEGRRIGLVFDQRGDPTASTMNTMEAVLTGLGATVAHKSHLAGGPNEAAAQVPIEVQQMQSKNVDVVFLASATVSANQFVNQSESQLFQPDWVASDWHVLYSDTSTANMPPSFDGAYNFSTSRQGDWRTDGFDTPGPRIEACEKLYEDATGEDIEWGQNDHALTMAWCTQINIFELAAKAAGVNLTAASFSQAITTIGEVPTTIYSGGVFAPGKTDLNDRYRTLRWSAVCRCFNPTDRFRPGRF